MLGTHFVTSLRTRPRRARVLAAPIARIARITPAALVAAALLTLAAPAPAADIWVGSSCPTTSIANALVGALGPDDDTIRIVGDLSNVDQNFVNWDPDTVGSITILGRHTTCGSTQRNGPRSEISGDASGPVFDISATSGNESVVTLDGLTIRDANNAYAVVANGSGANLTIRDSEISFSDGGLQVMNGADVEIDVDVSIRLNDVGSGQGGGINCLGSGSTVALGAIVRENDAGTGGGIAVQTGCVVTLRDGAYVILNDATWGGGIAVLNTGSTVITDPGLTFGIRIDDNTALQEGGGVWVVNSGSMVLQETWVRGNEAGDEGGGAYVDASGLFVMDRGDSFCVARRCSWLEGNTLASEGFGSAVFAGGNSTVNLYQTYIENHTGLNQRGFVLYAEDPGTTMRVESSQLWNNHTWALFRAVGNAVINPRWVSAALNDYRNILNNIVSSAGATTDTTGIVTIEASILQNHDTFFSQGGGSVTASCSYLTTSGGLAGGTTTLQTGTNPGFLDAPRGDLRVYTSSPTVDRCHTFAPTQRDLEHKLRGFDEPGIGFPGDVHDWGAFEATGLFFADGFESGNTSAWSDTVP